MKNPPERPKAGRTTKKTSNDIRQPVKNAIITPEATEEKGAIKAPIFSPTPF